MLSCETCEVLQKTIFKENCWSTAYEEHFEHIDSSDYEEHFENIDCFISKKSTNCLEPPETDVHK